MALIFFWTLSLVPYCTITIVITNSTNSTGTMTKGPMGRPESRDDEAKEVAKMAAEIRNHNTIAIGMKV
jgi:hypothetical protein